MHFFVNANTKQESICSLIQNNVIISLLLQKCTYLHYSSLLKNYRPVSTLSFFSKLLERVVQSRLQAFLDSNDMMPITQSAYRPFHSTETALSKVYNDLLLAADRGQVSALCLLDLTAAFTLSIMIC